MYTGGKGEEEEGWRRSAFLPTAAHTHPGKRGARSHSQKGPRQYLSRLCEIPGRFPHISAQSRWPFNQIEERKPNAGGGNLVHAATGPLGQVGLSDRSGTTTHPSPHCSPLRIPPDPQPPPLPHHGEMRQNQAPTPPPQPQRPAFPDPHRARAQLSVAHSPIKMRICFLPKRREKREEMVRPMAVVALAMGRSRRGLELPPAFSVHAPGKLSEEERS